MTKKPGNSPGFFIFVLTEKEGFYFIYRRVIEGDGK